MAASPQVFWYHKLFGEWGQALLPVCCWSLGAMQLFLLWEKFLFFFLQAMGCRKITQEKIHPGQECVPTLPARSWEASLTSEFPRSVAGALNPALTTECQHPPDTPPLTGSSHLGDKQVSFLDGFFFSLSPSYHIHKIFVCQQAMAKLPQCDLPVQHLPYTSISHAAL